LKNNKQNKNKNSKKPKNLKKDKNNNSCHKKFKILIWRQNIKGEVRCAHCCNWCMKLLEKYNIYDNIMTFKIINNNCHFENSYIKGLNIKPLLKCEIL
jgi:hypothetical protein